MATTAVMERNLAVSGILSKQQMSYVIPLSEVIRVLNAAKISYVLVGAHGLSYWRGKPRATEDVDVVVASKHVKKAVQSLLSAFPNLEPLDLEVVVRLRIRGTESVVIDVMKPTQQPYREVFKNACDVVLEGETVRIPSLEMSVVMKFSAIASLNRRPADKYQDAHDFILMVTNNPEMDDEKTAELACLIYPDGGKDVLSLVAKARSGGMLVL